jgi:DNA-binding transcriptional MerR regulator
MDINSEKKPFYRNTDDTLEDIGITRRQLGHWRKSGLFDPELGPTTKYFTEDDTEHLEFLKRLIVDLKLPVGTVKELIASTEGKRKGRKSATPRYSTFIDIEKVRLMQPVDATNQMIADTFASTHPVDIEKWFSAIALQAFRNRARTSKSSVVYEAHMKAVFDQLSRIDLMARLDNTYEPETGEPLFYFAPARESDPVLTNEEAERLAEERERLDKTIFEYGEADVWDRFGPPRAWGMS